MGISGCVWQSLVEEKLVVVTVTSTGTAVCNATLGCCTETGSPLSLLS